MAQATLRSLHLKLASWSDQLADAMLGARVSERLATVTELVMEKSRAEQLPPHQVWDFIGEGGSGVRERGRSCSKGRPARR